MSNADTHISCIPDVRVKVPRGEHGAIYERWQAGEAQEQIALDYQVKRQNVVVEEA